MWLISALFFVLVCNFSKAFVVVPNMRRGMGLKVTEERSEVQIFEMRAIQAAKGSPRVQKIKDMLVDKDILNLLASCEFAMRLAISVEGRSQVDYINLIERIERSLEILRLRMRGTVGAQDGHPLLQRLLATKEEMLSCMEAASHVPSSSTSSSSSFSSSSSSSSPSSSSSSSTEEGETGNSINIEEVAKENIPSLAFVVREDGSVDWDEALASTREAARFGAELWERLNGKEVEEGIPSIAELLGQAQVKEEKQTEEVIRLQGEVVVADAKLSDLLQRVAEYKARLRVVRADRQAILPEDVRELRRMENKVEELRKLVTLTRLDLDMERICVYLEQDLAEGGAGGSDALDLKLVVAEVNLIERQLLSVTAGLPRTVDEGVLDMSSDADSDVLASLVDEEELGILSSKVADLKSRLGIDTSGSKTIDWGTMGVVTQENLSKIREGISFYGDGTQMLVSDVQYAWRLLLKAAGGSTLKPREVNTMRRTGKDILTLVPFTIILIIPLSPVGHVLVFSFIQRFFPDFFPSCYTEKRLNLRKLYAEIEMRSDDPLLGGGRALTSTDGTDAGPAAAVKSFFSSAASAVGLQQETQEMK